MRAGSASRWVMPAAARRHTNPAFTTLLERVDAALTWPASYPSTTEEYQE
ncbi:MAG TPA: hypothetical protein PKL08_14995 [Thermoanaerobaculaceae bacterium]|nr:hypothetical protein [Thermoanaerobaculaceae bacterium]